jgi:hypothetical protein
MSNHCPKAHNYKPRNPNRDGSTDAQTLVTVLYWGCGVLDHAVTRLWSASISFSWNQKVPKTKTKSIEGDTITLWRNSPPQCSKLAPHSRDYFQVHLRGLRRKNVMKYTAIGQGGHREVRK